MMYEYYIFFYFLRVLKDDMINRTVFNHIYRYSMDINLCSIVLGCYEIFNVEYFECYRFDNNKKK